MGGTLKELAEQCGLLWMLVKWAVGAVVLALIVAFVVVALQPRPVLVVVVENRTADSLVQGRLTIRGREAGPLGSVVPSGMDRFIAKVPSESDVGVRFSRSGKSDIEAWAGDYFRTGDTAWIVMVAAGDSLVRQALSDRDAEAIAKSLGAPGLGVDDKANARPRDPRLRD